MFIFNLNHYSLNNLYTNLKLIKMKHMLCYLLSLLLFNILFISYNHFILQFKRLYVKKYRKNLFLNYTKISAP